MLTKTKPSGLLPATSAPLLADLKARIRAAQVEAALSVNRELILRYCHIGISIAARIVEERGTTFRLVLPTGTTA